MAKETSDSEKRDHLRRILNNARTGMLVTRRGGGEMHGRPMANAEVEEDFTRLWFATSRSSPKLAELQQDNRVFIGYTNAGGTEWAAVNGAARVVDDREKVKQLWSPIWKNWFSGPDDPDLTLLEVTPESAEYWDSGNKIVSMVKLAIGTITGSNEMKDANEKVKLR